jgi:FAD/FMN-containing dehydrogenase
MDNLHDALIEHGFSEDEITFPTSSNDIHIFNLLYPAIPRVVVTPHTTAQVSAAVQVANQFDLKVQARSGGHSYANYGLGGVDGHLVVDLKHFVEFEMDPNTWRASVGPRMTLKGLTQLLHDNGGRAVPHGSCPLVAVGGEIPESIRRGGCQHMPSF